MRSIGSTGHFRQKGRQSPPVLTTAPQAAPGGRFEMRSIGSTGHFRRTGRQSPPVLTTAPQAAP
jgi:hypothetical protein